MNVMLNHRPRRFSANVGYTLGEALNETDGALSLPPNSFDLSQEWGPSRQDVRHRLFASMNTDVKAGFRVNMNVRAQSASPYNITTGLDENRDGQTNERPAGVVRNSGRGEPTTNVDMGLVWERSVGQRVALNAQRGGGGGGGGGRWRRRQSRARRDVPFRDFRARQQCAEPRERPELQRRRSPRRSSAARRRPRPRAGSSRHARVLLMHHCRLADRGCNVPDSDESDSESIFNPTSANLPIANRSQAGRRTPWPARHRLRCRARVSRCTRP